MKRIKYIKKEKTAEEDNDKKYKIITKIAVHNSVQRKNCLCGVKKLLIKQ